MSLSPGFVAWLAGDSTICQMTDEDRVAWDALVSRVKAVDETVTRADDDAIFGEGGLGPLVVGVWCAVCHGPVYSSRSGEVCALGHGGAGEPQGDTDPIADVLAPAAPDLPPLYLDSEIVAELDAAAGWRPSPDQVVAQETLLEAFEAPGDNYRLSGAAGSGKSTLAKAILRRLPDYWDVILVAPTWRAANRLREITGRQTSSIHRAIYGRPVQKRLCPCGEWSIALMKAEMAKVVVEDPEGGPSVTVDLPRYTCETCHTAHEDATRFQQRLDFTLADRAGGEAPGVYRLVLVDEAGMVAPKVARDIRSVLGDDRTRILFVGDANQTGPVLDDKSDLDGAIDLVHATASLHQIHRVSAGNPVLAYAHTLKTVPGVSDVRYPFPRYLPGVHIEQNVPLDAPARWAATLRHAGQDVVLIAYSNKTRAAVNHAVRWHSGAVAAATAAGVNVIPGDRLLARGNSAGIYNGETWTVLSWERIPPGTAMMNDSSRARRAKPYYEHDRILTRGIGLFRVELAMIGAFDVRVHVHCVTAVNGDGLPMLESDLIRAGIEAPAARQACREVARAWREEYIKAIEEQEPEWERRKVDAHDKRIAGARFAMACEKGDRKAAERALGYVEKLSWPKAAATLRAQLAAGDLDGVDHHLLEAIMPGFAIPSDVALECASVQSWCRAAYGAIDPDTVAVFDFGEALTCQAMQGSQAKHVGAILDSAFWGCWKHAREDGLKWIYTAVTRTEDQLALFSIARQ
jgi:AAA domain-containing protein